MSAPLPTIASVVGQAPVPASVHDGSPEARRAYETALDFEKLLVGQLSQELIKSSDLDGEGQTMGGESSEAAVPGQAGDGLLAALVPTALTESLTSQGGLGLAGQLMGALDPAAVTAGAQATSVAATGGVAPSAPVPAGPASGAQSPGAVEATGGVLA
jgi:Rod binding domain-containing protein